MTNAYGVAKCVALVQSCRAIGKKHIGEAVTIYVSPVVYRLVLILTQVSAHTCAHAGFVALVDGEFRGCKFRSLANCKAKRLGSAYGLAI